MRRDLLFETDRFNLTEVGAHFVNPGCFGEDLARWLRLQLTERGVEAGEPGQEDWGWYFDAAVRGRLVLVGVGGNAAEPPRGDWGEWRVMLDPHRSLRERVAGKGRAESDAAAEQLTAIVRGILEAQPDFRGVREDE